MPLNQVNGRQARIHGHLYLISHRAVTECGHPRRFCLYPPVQCSMLKIMARCALHYYVRSMYVTHPYWWIFSGGSAPSSASRDDPSTSSPAPVEHRVRPLATAPRVLFATGRYCVQLVEQTFQGVELQCMQIPAGRCRRTMYSNMTPGCWRTELDGVLVDLSQHLALDSRSRPDQESFSTPVPLRHFSFLSGFDGMFPTCRRTNGSYKSLTDRRIGIHHRAAYAHTKS